MALIPVEHPRRLQSPAEAEAFYRGLGDRHVSARGFHTRDVTRIEKLVEAIDPEREHTISFQQGTLGPAARAALDVLAHATFGYLDLRVRNHEYCLRVWPSLHTWVHHGAETLETKSIDEALRLFHSVTVDKNELTRGFINGVKPAAKKPLLDFLRVVDAQVDAVLDIDVASARAVTELYRGERLDWQSNMLLVDFPEGRINGYLLSSAMGESERAEWQKRVTKALERAGLSP